MPLKWADTRRNLTVKGKVKPMVNNAVNNLLADAGRRIRANRAGQGLSLEQLARLTGISAPALSLIETGRRDPRLTTLTRIADALRVPLAALIADGYGAAEDTGPEQSLGYDLGDYQ
jgi:transcriptional regulator with XRE-family HTH domain